MKATDTDTGEALLFDIGDKVVYPHHGAGTVVRKEKREVLVLVELEDVRGDEVGELTNVNINTIYTRLRAARRAFELAFEERQNRAAARANATANAHASGARERSDR